MKIFTAALISSALLVITVGSIQTDAATNQTVLANQTSVKLAKVKNKKRGKKNNKLKQCNYVSFGGILKRVCD
jgi:hypothetical protein